MVTTPPSFLPSRIIRPHPIIPTNIAQVLALAVRWMKARRHVRPLWPSGFPLFLNVIGFIAVLFIWRWFAAIGTPRRDASGIKVGDDLGGKGIVELAWDV